jgi:uncharacterized membrane protein YeaQ/YmgE (transglycosylase-associated protein family)
MLGQQESNPMSILAFIVLGLLAGFISSKIVDHSGQGIIIDLVLGVVGAFVGGFIFTALGSTGVTGFNVWSLIVATLGAIVVLVIKHALMGRRSLA